MDRLKSNSGKFSLIKYQPDYCERWDGVVKGSRNGTFLHLRDYFDYHQTRFHDESLIVYRKSEPVAIFPCNRVSDQIISHGGLTYGGLIYGPLLRAVDVLDIFVQICEFFRQAGIVTLTYKAVPHIFHKYPAEEDLYALYRLGAHLVRRDLSIVIKLSNRPGWSELRRRAIRKAERRDLVVREGEFFPEFCTLLKKVLAKHNATPVHALEELELLRSRFPERIRLFGTFSTTEKLLAGVLIYDFGHSVHTQYSATSMEGKQLGALDILLSRLIENEFSQRQYFSFGISTEQSGRYLNEGLAFQKEGFGGRTVVHDFYELDL